MRKVILIIIALLFTGNLKAIEYILYDADKEGNNMPLDPFRFYFNEAEIVRNSDGLIWNIYNIYFTASDFESRNFSPTEFLHAYDDYKQLRTDILISITPLYLNNKDKKVIELKNKAALDTINFISPGQLLQRSIRNLYAADFASDNECLPENVKRSMNARIKSLDYKLVIKERGKYYLIDNDILTEFYYIYASNFVFPNEIKGYGGIYLPEESQYFTPGYIWDTLPKERGGLGLNERWKNYQLQTCFKTYCASADSLGSLNLFNYWIYGTPPPFGTPKFINYKKFIQVRPYIVRNGIGSFQFFPRIGILNGNYDFYLNDDLRNRKTDGIDKDPLVFSFSIKTINNKPVRDFINWYKKEFPPKFRGIASL
ncbi:hypothetical protein [Chitinophaga polysaccharea]|uniref:hypothetical protein n=1 Tax=Chitinophaga polysaccharea TaxID=1293035 RepID=UPI00115A2801|nr:hypothetical protein [Chitinophaga polysaccharea]